MSKNTWLAIGAVVILLVLIFVLAGNGDDTVDTTVDTDTPTDTVDTTDVVPGDGVTDESDAMTDTTDTDVEADVQVQ